MLGFYSIDSVWNTSWNDRVANNRNHDVIPYEPFPRFSIHWSVSSQHNCGVKMGVMAYQLPSLTDIYSSVHSGADQRKHQSSESLAFVRGIHRWPVNSSHKWSVTRKMFPLDDVIIKSPVLEKFEVMKLCANMFVPVLSIHLSNFRATG